MNRNLSILGCSFVLVALLTPAAGAITVRILPSALTVVEGSLFSVDLVADLDMPVLGWGLDFGSLGALPPGGAPVVLEGAPVLGPAWLAVASTDGDGLAGAAFPDGLVGNGVLLASVSLRAVRPGDVFLGATTTPGDLTEGFALDPSGFASSFGFDSLSVSVRPVPEPSALLLVASGVLALTRRRISA